MTKSCPIFVVNSINAFMNNSLQPNKSRFSAIALIATCLFILLIVLLLLVYFKSDISGIKFLISAQKDPFEAQMIAIPAGSFMMGVEGGNSYEKPVHSVDVAAFELCKYEVTQKQWLDIMGNNPSRFTECEECPVESVSWDDIQIFLHKLNEISHKNYRLPTEAEWEYAAQVGKKSDTIKVKLSNIAWFNDNAEEKTHIVGRLATNAIGLYDMSGNVWEWFSDWYDENAYQNQQNADYEVPKIAKSLRGGSWFSKGYECRISNRYFLSPKESNVNSGFRLAL
jgi:formylglycine-generating enzyme required for sulfatase activity